MERCGRSLGDGRVRVHADYIRAQLQEIRSLVLDEAEEVRKRMGVERAAVDVVADAAGRSRATLAVVGMGEQWDATGAERAALMQPRRIEGVEKLVSTQGT